MERASDVFVTPLSVAWDDLGTWDAIGRVLETDSDDADDRTVGGDVLPIDASNNVVAAPDAHVSLLDVDDLIVAAFDDRILVAPRDFVTASSRRRRPSSRPRRLLKNRTAG